MKIVTLVLSLLVITIVTCNEPAGIRAAIKDESAVKTGLKFLPRLIDLVNTIKVPNPDAIKVDVGISTLYIYLSDIKFFVKPLDLNRVSVNFKEPNIVDVNVDNVAANASLKVRTKLSFISETDNVTVNVKKASGHAILNLTRKEHPDHKGKYQPDAIFKSLDINADYDFDIRGSLVAWIARLAKNAIKNEINSLIHNEIKNLVIKEATKAKDDLLKLLPVYIPILPNGLAVDYSVLSDPKVIDNYIVVSSNGAVVNTKIPETLTPIYPMKAELPDYDKEGKDGQGFVTEYSLNTAANTLLLSKMLKFMLETSDIPADSPVQFNTSTMDLIVHGLEAKYGKKKQTQLWCIAKGLPPVVKFISGKIDAIIYGDCTLKAESENGIFEDVITFSSEAELSAEIQLIEEGKIKAKVKKVKLSNSKTITTKFPDTDIKELEMGFNTFGYISIPVINNAYLKVIDIPLPKIEGIGFTDSKVEIKEKYAELNLTPTFSDN